jgi:hypothetical protein
MGPLNGISHFSPNERSLSFTSHDRCDMIITRENDDAFLADRANDLVPTAAQS